MFSDDETPTKSGPAASTKAAPQDSSEPLYETIGKEIGLPTDVEHIEEVEWANPEDLQARFDLAQALHAAGDVEEAVKNTLMTAGRAMLTTSVVLSCGFFIFMFASMNIFFYFGLLAGCAVLLALGADLLLAPALMAVVIDKRKDGLKIDKSS